MNLGLCYYNHTPHDRYNLDKIVSHSYKYMKHTLL